MSKKSYKDAKNKRLGGSFISVPLKIFKSKAYQQLPSKARDIIIFVHTQYNGNNNGDLTCTYKAIKENWGMKIAKRTFYRNLAKCLDQDILIKTVQGGKHKASRFAVASYSIDDIDSMEIEKPSKYPLTRFERHEIKSTGLLKSPKKSNKVSTSHLTERK